MSTIRRTAPKAPPSSSSRTSGCGVPLRSRASYSACGVSGCGGWTAKATRPKSTAKTSGTKKKAETHKKQQKVATGCGGWSAPTRKSQTVSACGGGGWTRYGRLPSGC